MNVVGRCYPVDIFYVQGKLEDIKVFFKYSLTHAVLHILSTRNVFIDLAQLLFLDPVSDYLKASVDTVIKISIHEPSGDVLVFLTGFEEVEAVVRLLKEYANTIADTTNKGNLYKLSLQFCWQNLIILSIKQISCLF